MNKKVNKEQTFNFQFSEKEAAIIEILLSMGINTGEQHKLKDKEGKEIFLSESCFPLKRKFVEEFKKQIKNK
jgi:hypothetical protein